MVLPKPELSYKNDVSDSLHVAISSYEESVCLISSACVKDSG